MAFMEPHEKVWKGESGKYFTLSEVTSKSDTVAPFVGVCGFSSSLATYSGTIFRFPLRNVASGLSEQLYDLDKLKALFGALKCEGKNLLLFLRSVDTVEVYEIDAIGQQSMKFKTSIANEERDIVFTKRKEFLQRVQQEHMTNGYCIRTCIALTMDFRVMVVDGVVTTIHHWIVISQVGSSNEGVLQSASRYRILPWVGAAKEIEGSQTLVNTRKDGRVFCFLPMPIDPSFPLPIYVNGTFGLSDDRRTLKWQSSERQNDSAAEWNKVLVRDVMPQCYALLIRYAIDNIQMSYTEVYSIWPNLDAVKGTEWEPLLSALFKLLTASDKIVWTSVPSEIASSFSKSGEWISIGGATFIPENVGLMQLAQVHSSLQRCGVKMVEAPASVHSALHHIGCAVSYLTPALAREKMKSNLSCYQSAVADKKIELLMYCLSDNQYNALIGLELLPLANNTFTTFQQRTYYSQPIYICNSSFPKELFPNNDHLIVRSLHADVLTKVASSNWTQVQLMDFDSAVRLIKQCFPSQWQQQQQVTVRSTDPLFPAAWFATFWKWVQPHDLSRFAGDMVVPLGREPISHASSFHVTRLSSKSPVLYLTYNDLGSYPYLLPILQKLPLKIASTEADSSFLHTKLDSYVQRLTPAGILDALSNSCNEQFSQLHGITITNDEARQLCVLLSQLTQLPHPRYQVLLNLPIFSSLNQSSLCNAFTSAQVSWGKKAVLQPQELPLSVQHLPDSLVVFLPLPHQLPLLKLLSDHMQAPTVMQFVMNILLPMISQGTYKPLSNMDAIMSEIIIQLPTWKWQYPQYAPSLIKSLSELPFLPVDGNVGSQRRCPKDLYDPSNVELSALFRGELVFPCAPFNGQSQLILLKECGLMSEVSPQALLNIIAAIGLPSSAVPQQVDPVKYNRAKAVLNYIGNHHFSNEAQLIQVTKSYSWLPISSTPPNGYPPCLSWKGSCCTSHFISSNIFVPSVETSELPLILGSQIFIVDACVPQSLSAVLSTPSLGPLVVGHFQDVIAHHADIAPSCLEKMVHLIYRYLNKQVDVGSLLKTLPQWVYIKGKFVSPEVVAVESNNSFSQDLSPYVHTLPDSFASQYQDLFARCGVQKTLTRRQICSVLEMMHRSGGSEVSPERAWHIVVSILNWLTSNGEEMAQLDEGETLFVPIECDSKAPRLEDFTKVTYSDNEFLHNALSAAGQEVQYIFLNHRVTSLAHCLHISPLSDHLSITEDAFEDAGQHEPLTVRLKNILKEYKDGLTIIKEMLQNADDAGATELNICYDARTHTTERKALFFPDMVDSHGPALLVHNNSTFTDDDFRNITKLAGATKEGAPLKIGKFGVGFCSVYHITDVPSFISRDCLHIFDPTLKYLKGAVKDITKPGKKLNLANPILRSSKQLQPYEGLFGFNRQQCFNGTMFRLPFRTSPSEISSTMYSKYTIDEMVSDLKKSSSELILFLRHIAKITFCSIEADSSTPHVLVEIEKTSQQCGGNSLSKITTRENGGSSSSKLWLVSTSEESTSQKQRTSSVACSLEMQDGMYYVQRCIGETFCFLPLSNSTGLPVHVSANFAVMTNRRGIWTEDSHTSHSTTESQWNVQLMETVIPKAYYSMLMGLKGLEQEGKLTGYIFHSLWPLEKELEQHHPWTVCIAALYKMISVGELMYSSTTSQWLSIKDSRFIAPAIFALSSAHPDTPPCIVETIEGLCIPVVDLPLEYRKYLQLEQSTITEQVFIELFFRSIGLLQSMQDCRNAVLVTLLEVFAVEIGKGTERERTLKVALEGHSCVPCSPHGATLKKCCDLVDPQSEFATMFEDTDGMFPSASDCRSGLTKQAMLKLGLHHDSIPWEFIIERSQTIGSLYKLDYGKALRRVQCILQSISKSIALCPGRVVPEKARSLASVPFLPVKQKPERYPLSWFGDSCPHLLCGRDLVSYAETNMSAYYDVDLVVGSTAAIVQQNIADGAVIHLPLDVCNLLQIKTIPSCTDVVTHLKHLIGAVQQFESDTMPSIHQICDAVYKYLDLVLVSDIQATTSAIDELKTLSCVWTEKTFVCPNMVAKKWALDGPYLFKVPPILITRERLIGLLGIQLHFTVNDTLQALQKMSNDFGNEPVSKECQEVIDHIIPLLHKGEIENINQKVILPDEKYVMCDASQLAFNDTPWCQANEDTKYLHSIIPRSLALRLGVNTVRSLIIEQYASLFEYTDAEGFGQSEPLTLRIQNILQDYPCDETVLKELLQNADDAKANKMYIILDKRTHGERVFNDSWKDLQGPALLVWNNSIFSENDLKGIQKLGLGGKRSDAETIGQYGIGFNVAYHLTDCPSFVSNGDTMCILDPHCRYAPGANTLKPGRRFDRLSKGFWQKFPDLKLSYLQEGVGDCPQKLQDELKGGSLFRFPLRHTSDMIRGSQIVPLEPNGIKPLPVDARKMQRLLDKWAPCIKQSMFFLNNVTEIKFFVIEEGSHQLDVTHHFSTCVDQAGRRQLDEFKEYVRNFEDNSEPKTAMYTLCLSETQTHYAHGAKSRQKEEKTTERWLIQQGVGDTEEDIQRWPYIKQMKPRHGIAAPLDASNPLDGHVYCFLPLPIISHLPVHINGHFALNTARRDLWKPTDPTRAIPDDPRLIWNKNLISAISSSYQKFLVDGRRHIVQQKGYTTHVELRHDQSISRYYNTFPDLSLKWNEGVYLGLANDVYKKLIKHNARVLAVTDHQRSLLLLPSADDVDQMEEASPMLSIKWHVLHSATPREQAHLLEVATDTLYHHKKHQRSTKPVTSIVQAHEHAAATPLASSAIVPSNGHLPNASISELSQQIMHFSIKDGPPGGNHKQSSAPTKHSDKGDDIQSILEMTGMVITCAPRSIRAHLSTHGLTLPTTTPRTVFTYYSEYCEQVLPPGGRFPCDIEDTKFKTVANFSGFLSYILAKCSTLINGTTAFVFQGPGQSFPEGVPLLLTADQQIRKFDKKALVLASKFCDLFPDSHNKFLHPDLLPLEMVSEYFLTAIGEDVKFYTENLHDMLDKILPEELLNEKAESELVDENMLKYLWKCFANDAVFKSCLSIIVKKWAVLPSQSKQLFSTKSEVLPMVQPKSSQGFWSITDLLHSLEMPFLEQWLPSAAHQFCPQIEQHNKVLLNLVNLIKSTVVKVSKEDVKILFGYFRHINFQSEPECIGHIRCLPCFQDVFGKWTDLNGRTAYVLPQHITVCLEGVEMCLKNSSAVLLDPNGEWRVFRASEINITEIQNEDLYIRCIFSSFSTLQEDQRYKHLEHIRDNLYQPCCAKIQYTRQYEYTSAHKFVNTLKELRCLGPDNSLKPVYEFCDHTLRIFHISKKMYNFLPKCFTSTQVEETKWLVFFRELGLKKSIPEHDFMQIIQTVINGQSDIPIERASSILLQYLFECHHDYSSGVLHKISTMTFVPVRELKHLTWIAPACSAPLRIQNGQEKTIEMTHLRGAYCGKKEELVWSVMPVISLRNYSASNLTAFGVVDTPSIKDVMENIVHISKGPLSNRALFDQAPCGNIAHESDTDLVTVMSSIFEFLHLNVVDDAGCKQLDSLNTLACVPVNARMQLGPPVSVLVMPSHVVASDEASQYFPFLHCLPHSLYVHIDTVLQRIGVKKSIEPMHIKTVLEMVYKQSDQLHLDINTMKTVHTSLRTLYTLLKKMKGTDIPSLAPLYLPDQSGKLCQSTLLVYCDNVQYSHKVLDFSRAGLSIFLLPPQLGIQEEEFCSLLPEAVRPKCISKCITKVRHANPLEVDSPIVTQIQQTLRMPELIKAIVKIIQHLTGGSDCTGDIHGDLTRILSGIQVCSVHDLSHSIAINQPAQDIGVIKLKYELTEESGQFSLYIESARQSQVSMITCKLVCDAMSDLIVRRLVSFSKQQAYDILLRLKEYISTLLMAQRLEDIQEVLQTLNLRLDTREISYHDQEPKLGDPIPLAWHHRLDQAPGNIFRPQEWVGYETEDDSIIFAQIVHPVESTDVTSGNLRTKYRVYIAEDDVTGILVSTLSLYKFLRGATSPDTRPSNVERGLVLVAQPTIPRADVTAYEAMLQLNKELKEVWQLSENEKKTALRRYYLQWHPDKNLGKVALAEEVYKYLRQQISRLEHGLPLQDPPKQSTAQPAPESEPPPSKWQPHFTEWDSRAHSHQQSQKSEERESSKTRDTSSRQGSSKWQTNSDLSQGRLWIRQAEADWGAACVLLGQASTNASISCHVCFFSYEAMSKAVRGGLMAVCGLRERGGVQENLIHQAMALEAEVPQLRGCIVRCVEVLVNYETSTRFPHAGQPVPALFFNADHARVAEKHASTVLQAVKDAILK